MLYSPEHKFAFIHIPKTAGSSIEEVLDPHSMGRGHFRYHAGAPAMANILSPIWDDLLSFTVVRNPWDRVVSQYHYILQAEKLNHPKHGAKEWVENMEGGFEEFVTQCIFLQKASFIARPQTSWIARQDENGDWGETLVKRVMKFENVQVEFDEFCDDIGIDKIALPVLARTDRPRPYQSIYNAKTRKMVEEMFEEDIKRFGYTFE